MAKTGKHPWRENFEGLALAIIAALILKFFVIEAYKIPTGSMQPTLMGIDDKIQIFDRILVDKFYFLRQEPQRWEVIVFKYPLDQSKNYIKRLIGLPGETIQISGGNIYLRLPSGELKIARKPHNVQATLWKEVFRSEGPEDEVRAPQDFWVQESGSWQIYEGLIKTTGAGRLRFKNVIRDLYADGYPQKIKNFVDSSISRQSQVHSGIYVVGDLQISFDVLPNTDCQSVIAKLGAGDKRYQCILPGPAGDGNAKILLNDQVVASTPFVLPIEKKTQVRFSHVDEAEELEINGKTLLRHEFENLSDRNWNVSTNLVGLETTGSGATFEKIRIDRDLHYVPSTRGEYSWNVPLNNYFFLGDNTQNSSDGRAWQERTITLSSAGGIPVVLHGDGSLEDNPKGPTSYIYEFRDKLGESHRYHIESFKNQNDVPAPFVPRDFIIGKAIFVFWPMPPFSPIPRWKVIF